MARAISASTPAPAPSVPNTSCRWAMRESQKAPNTAAGAACASNAPCTVSATSRASVRAFTPMMLEAARSDPAYQGHIVNTASMAGLLTPPNMGIYNVSKHAVVALTETLYQDLKLVTDQISASVLCPYFVTTGIHNSERNRPADMPAGELTASQRIQQAMTEKATGSGKVTAADVAGKVFDAIAQDQFYVFSHPKALGNVKSRTDAIVNIQNPPDPFAERPEIGVGLRQALRGGAA